MAHAGDATSGQAQVDANTAWVALMGRPTQVSLTGQDLGGLVLPPAVYSFAASAQLTGVLTLNGLGNPNAQFVFKIGSALTTASNSAVLLINGANGANVYWAVGSSATLGTNSVFAGNIVALTSITLTTGASLSCGRAIALNGAVTLDTNTITLCVGTSTPGFTGFTSDIALATLFGEGVAGSQQMAFGASRLFGAAVMREAAFWRDGVGQDLTGMTPSSNAANGANGGAMKLGALQNAPLESGAVASGYQPRTWRMWTAGFGGAGSLDGDAAKGTADLRTHTAGFAVGFDHQIDRATLAGIAVGYTNSGYSVDQRTTSGAAEGAHVALYGVRRFGPLYLAGTAEYAHFFNRSNRFIDWIIDEQAAAKFSSDEYSGRLEAGWQISRGMHRVTPFVGLEAAHLRTRAFTESSVYTNGFPGILGLTFASGTATSVASVVGLQLDSRIALADSRTLMPFVRVAWVHEFDPDRSVTASLTQSPAATFTADGAAVATDVARVSAGARLDVTSNVGLFAFFDGDFSGQSQTYGGQGGIKISW